jgi:Mg-chelatase subunit ChlD
MKRALLPSLWLLLLAGTIGCNGGPEVTWDPPTDYAKRVNAQGQTVLLVIDRSLSMRSTDPGNFNIAGSQIAVSILDEKDNVGIVTFADAAEAVFPTRSLASHEIRTEVRQKLDSIKMNGMATDFTQGLGMAKALLGPLKLPKEKVSVVFLTDGSHSVLDTLEGVPPLIDEFAAAGWKIYSIAFGSKISKIGGKGLLQEMATKTKGAYFKIEKARDLPRAFVQIFSHIKDFMTYKGEGALRVQKLMKKLLFLMIKKRRSDRFGHVSRDGKVVDLAAEKVYHYPEGPATGSRVSRFEIISFQRPKVGAYKVRTPKGPEVWKLATFPLKVSLAPGSPPAQVEEGNAFDLVLNVSCEDDAVAEAVRGGSSVRALFTPEGAEAAAMEITCIPVTGKGRVVTFKGSASLALPRKGQAEVFEVKTTFGLVDETGGTWEVTKLASVKVVPGPPPLLRVTPPQADFGKRWADEGELIIPLVLETGISGSVKVKVSNPQKLADVTPLELTVDQANKGTVTVRLSPEKFIAAGERKGVFQLAFSASGGGRAKRVTVPVLFDIYSFKGPAEIAFDHVPPGYQIAKDFQIEIVPAVHPFRVEETRVVCGESSIPIIAVVEKISKDEAERPSDEGGTPPADEGEKPSDEGETPPADEGEKPSDEGETPPADEGEKPSDEGETPPADEGEKPSDEGETPPADEGEKPSDEGETPPADEGEKPSDEGETPPPDEGEKPGDDSSQPPDEGTTPPPPPDEGEKPPDEEKPSDEPGAESPPGKTLAELVDDARSATGLNFVTGRSFDGRHISRIPRLRPDSVKANELDALLQAGRIDPVEHVRRLAQLCGCALEMLGPGLYRVYQPPVMNLEDLGPERTPEELSATRARWERELRNASLPPIVGDEDAPGGGKVDLRVRTLGEAASGIGGQMGLSVSVSPDTEGLGERPFATALKGVDWKLALRIAAEQADCSVRRTARDAYEFYKPAEEDRDETEDKKPDDEEAETPAPGEGTEEPGAPGEEKAPGSGTEKPAPAEEGDKPGEEGKEEGPKEGEEKAAAPEPSRFRVVLSIPTTQSTPEGLYEGKLVFSMGGNPPLIRTIPLKAPISLPPPKVEIKKAKIEGSPAENGVLACELEVTLKTPFTADLVLDVSDLRPDDPQAGVVSKTFDIRLKPSDGWDGKALEPNRPYTLRYRAFFSSDLEPGTYTGQVVLRMKSRGKESEQRVPVTVQVP